MTVPHVEVEYLARLHTKLIAQRLGNDDAPGAINGSPHGMNVPLALPGVRHLKHPLETSKGWTLAAEPAEHNSLPRRRTALVGVLKHPGCGRIWRASG